MKFCVKPYNFVICCKGLRIVSRLCKAKLVLSLRVVMAVKRTPFHYNVHLPLPTIYHPLIYLSMLRWNASNQKWIQSQRCARLARRPAVSPSPTHIHLFSVFCGYDYLVLVSQASYHCSAALRVLPTDVRCYYYVSGWDELCNKDVSNVEDI